jgi:hypothetical protein
MYCRLALAAYCFANKRHHPQWPNMGDNSNAAIADDDGDGIKTTDSGFTFVPYCYACRRGEGSMHHHADRPDDCCYGKFDRVSHGKCQNGNCRVPVLGHGTLSSGEEVDVCSAGCGQLMWLREKSKQNRLLLMTNVVSVAAAEEKLAAQSRGRGYPRYHLEKPRRLVSRSPLADYSSD